MKFVRMCVLINVVSWLLEFPVLVEPQAKVVRDGRTHRVCGLRFNNHLLPHIPLRSFDGLGTPSNRRSSEPISSNDVNFPAAGCGTGRVGILNSAGLAPALGKGCPGVCRICWPNSLVTQFVFCTSEPKEMA